MKVLKFGGTSVGTVESLANVKKIVDSLEEPGIVVVSALGGLTDKLISNAYTAASGDESFRVNMRQMSQRHFDILEAVVPREKESEVRRTVGEFLAQLEDIYTGLSMVGVVSDKVLNRIVSFGERMSSVIVAAMLRDATHADSLEFMKTEKWCAKDVASQTTDGLIAEHFNLPLDRTIVTGGFISRDRKTGEITNLGRGGSDYTAALIAAALDAETLEIWTDVDGFLTADPRIIPDAKVIESMSYGESMELCTFGAKVVYPPTIYPVFHKEIPIKILNTHNPSAPGTLITDKPGELPRTARGISALRNISLITISGLTAPAGCCETNSRVYKSVSSRGIDILLVARPECDGSYCIALPEADTDNALEALRDEFAQELLTGSVKSISAEGSLSVIAVVRDSIGELEQLPAQIAAVLEESGVKVRAVSDDKSETVRSFVVAGSDTGKALAKIHDFCFA